MGRDLARRPDQEAAEQVAPGRPRGGPSVLALQRTAGNAAVAQLVQRQAKTKKPPKGAKKDTKPKKKYHDIPDKQREEWDAGKCAGWAGDAAKDKRFLEAAAYYQLAFEKTQNKNRQFAFNAARMFKELGDAYKDDYDYWMAVANRAKEHPLAPEFRHI